MSNEKISIQELVDVIAQQTGSSKKKSEEFLKVFQGTIEEGLITDRLVKIKGFGTFKLIWNEARKSVNVQTGKEYVIPGHTKVTFTPDAKIKEFINNPNAILTTPKKADVTKGIDPIKKLNKEAEEIKEIIADIKDMKKSDETPKPQELKKEVAEAPKPVQPVQPVVKDSNESIQHAALSEKHVLQERDIPVKPKRKGKKIVIVVLILLIIAGGAAGYIYKKDALISIKDKVLAKVETLKEKAAQKQAAEEVSEEETKTIVVESKVSEETAVEAKEVKPVVEEKVVAKPKVSVFDKARDHKSTLATITIRKGDRLVLIAEKYYGHKDFWVYIYEANKNILNNNPDSLFAGMIIRVPKLNSDLINLKNPACLKYAKGLENKYLAK